MQQAITGGGRLGWGRRLSYAVGDLGNNFYWQSVSLFLFFFYTDVMGIDPFLAGISFGFATLYDAFADPVMGTIADRNRSRWGRFRPYILLGAVPLAASFALMFYIPAMGKTGLLVYATLTHMLMRTAYTVVNIPYLAMSASVTSDSAERTTLAGLRMMLGASAALLVAFFLPKAVAAMGKDVAQPYFVVSLVIGVLGTVAYVVCAVGSREQVGADGPAAAAVRRSVLGTIGHDCVGFWSSLRRNTQLARLIGVMVMSSSAMALLSKCLLYWFKYSLHKPQSAPLGLVALTLTVIVCAPLWVLVAKRFSKRNACMAGCLLAAAGYFALWLDHSGTTAAVVASICVVGAGMASLFVMGWAMLPDTVEYSEWTLGERNEAKAAGFAVFATKIAIALNALVLGKTLAWAGFVANQEQSDATLAGIKATMCLAPMAAMVLAVLLLRGYIITPALHARIVQELAARRSRA